MWRQGWGVLTQSIDSSPWGAMEKSENPLKSPCVETLGKVEGLNPHADGFLISSDSFDLMSEGARAGERPEREIGFVAKCPIEHGVSLSGRTEKVLFFSVLRVE